MGVLPPCIRPEGVDTRPEKTTITGKNKCFGARRARKFKFSHFFGLLLRVRSGRPLHIYRPTRVQLNRSCFKPDTEERSTYLYRAYTKWCEDNLESPVPQKKFSQFLLKNAGKYGLTFSKHIEGKYRGFRGVCVHPAFAAA